MLAKGSFWWLFIPFILTISFIFLTFYMDSLFLIGFFISSIITILFLIFFRDPEREIGNGIVSPADGKIRDIIFNKSTCFISIFMDVYNVHVNRIPIDGKIENINHFPGKHFRAWKKESDENEKVIIDISTKIGNVKIIQLAGLIARRIYPYIKVGNYLKKGDRIGIIRFGSRVDLYLPAIKIKSVPVKIGEKVFAGVTTIAEI